jgi:methyl-accepting chemotaxis protein
MEAVNALSEQAVEVHDSSDQLTKTADLLSNSSSQAAASIEETTASMEEISSMIKINTENGGAAALLAEESFSKATTGKAQSNELSVVMQEIVRDSKRIEEILFVIDDISFQTNLLALNAAVEAARAGEQGKGFAVVAEAVRTLAQRSSASAKEIGDLIKSSIERISKGSAYVVETEKSLTEIVSSVEKVMKINKEVSSAGQEQSRGIQQIASAISEIDRSTQSNAAASEQVSASSTTLLTSADRFTSIVTGLRDLVEGQSDRVA